jgi:hypothetical protein
MAATSGKVARAGVHASGGCLCGAVRYEVTGPLRDVVECHCAMCRRTHGHIGAYSAAARDALRLTGTRGLKWYRSSPGIRRGFCCECGASLFWDAEARATISIAAGTIDPPTGLNTVLQIHVASAGDYYAVDRAVPQRDD